MSCYVSESLHPNAPATPTIRHSLALYNGSEPSTSTSGPQHQCDIMDDIDYHIVEEMVRNFSIETHYLYQFCLHWFWEACLNIHHYVKHGVLCRLLQCSHVLCLYMIKHVPQHMDVADRKFIGGCKCSPDMEYGK